MKNTEAIAWTDAKAIVAEWQRAGSWDGSIPPAVLPANVPPVDDGPQRITVTEALNAYLAIRSG